MTLCFGCCFLDIFFRMLGLGVSYSEILSFSLVLFDEAGVLVVGAKETCSRLQGHTSCEGYIMFFFPQQPAK